ncbi:MAG: hypothetical protein HYW63_03150 [Candidatus Levybacteria bacterium]|nr:hypothetical protein [Candidatus Levybacteria bacterium]
MSTAETAQTDMSEGFPRSMAEIAYFYFIRASMACPASVTAQGAVIALIVRETGENPLELREALLEDQSKLQAIKSVADRIHPDNVRASHDVPMEKVIEVVGEGFALANDFRFLTTEKLELLRGSIYQRFAHNRTGEFPEHSMREAAEAYLRGRHL